MMVLDFAKSQSDVALYLVNVAPRWRRIDDLAHWKRILFGGLTMIWHLTQRILKSLASQFYQSSIFHDTSFLGYRTSSID